MTLIESELRAALRAEATVHRPDRKAILDRFAQNAMRPRRTPRLRFAGVTVAITAVLGVGGFARWAVAGDSDPSPPAVTAGPSPSGLPVTGATPSAGTPRAVPSKPAPRSRTSSRAPARAPEASPSPPAAPGALWSDGSVTPDGDSQSSSIVTVTTSRRVTAIEVTIRLARTELLTARGGSQQVPGASVTSTVAEEAGAIVYRFVLSSDDRLEPGTYTFAARYRHQAGGRDAGADSYRVAAVLESGGKQAVSGTFD